MQIVQRRFPACVLVICAGCGAVSERVPETPAFAIRDSAGVQIVESHRPAWRKGEGWTLAAEPALSVGAVSGADEYNLHKVIGATRMSDGRIVVAVNDPAELRFFDSSGVFLRRSGRRGVGPGEFGSLKHLFRFAGDSLLVHDARNAFIVLDAAGEIVRHQSLGNRYFQILDLLGIFADGRVVARMYHGEGPERNADSAANWRVYRVLKLDGTTAFSYRYPIEQRSSATFSPGATFLATLGGPGKRPTLEKYHVQQAAYHQAAGLDHFFFGDAAKWDISAYAPSGELSRILRVTMPLETIPAAVKKDTATLTMGSAMYQPVETIWPEFYPAFRTMHTDRTGNLWASMAPRAGASPDTVRYNVFDSRGVLLGEVRVPARLRIHEIGRDYLLASVMDSLDVESITLYEIRKPAG